MGEYCDYDVMRGEIVGLYSLDNTDFTISDISAAFSDSGSHSSDGGHHGGGGNSGGGDSGGGDSGGGGDGGSGGY
jgi:hypothetical protein